MLTLTCFRSQFTRSRLMMTRSRGGGVPLWADERASCMSNYGNFLWCENSCRVYNVTLFLLVHLQSSHTHSLNMELTVVNDLGQTFVVEVDPNMELENVMALLEAEVRQSTWAWVCSVDVDSLGFQFQNKAFITMEPNWKTLNLQWDNWVWEIKLWFCFGEKSTWLEGNVSFAMTLMPQLNQNQGNRARCGDDAFADSRRS